MNEQHYEYLQRATREELLAIIDYLETKVERLEGELDECRYAVENL